MRSETYDSVPNPLIAVEEPVVRSLLGEAPSGAAALTCNFLSREGGVRVHNIVA